MANKLDKKGLKIETLFESEDIVVLNKPTGLMVHADGRSDEYTLADYVGEAYPNAIDVGEALVLEKGMPGETAIKRPGIVHRLDRDTSGAIIVAKTNKSFPHLKRQFKNHTIKKVYRALVTGHIKNDTGIIDAPIGRSKSDFRVRTTPDLHTKDSRGALRNAVTRYKVLERLTYKDGEDTVPVTYVEIYPETGRTHQIRTHFKSIRHPLLGDPLYGPGKNNKAGLLDAKRTMLHAAKITFKVANDKDVVVEAPLPEDFKGILAKLS